MFLLIDNYDSFTYNLYHLIKQTTNNDILVKRNDKISLDEIKTGKYRGIFLSPGPCTPLESGICIDIIKYLHKEIPIFGVCLGMQTMVHVFGGNVIEAEIPMHGKVSTVQHFENSPIFKNIPTKFNATRYHSLIAEEKTLPKELKITAKTDDKNALIMALSHEKYNMHGVQFHPESIASEYGMQMIKNFIDLI